MSICYVIACEIDNNSGLSQNGSLEAGGVMIGLMSPTAGVKILPRCKFVCKDHNKDPILMSTSTSYWAHGYEPRWGWLGLCLV